MAHSALKGLYFLHKRNIVHRDIKSDNVLYNYKGEVKLADFGFATALTTEEKTQKDAMGTLLYMAPELCKEENYDCKVDIWSFGIMMVELANQMRPYDDMVPFPDSPEKILALHEKGVPRVNDKKAWSETFLDFIDRCL